MFTEYFIKRPILASVFAIAFVIAGAISILNMSVTQYPDIAPPQVGVNASYLGADAQTVESGVTNLLEDEINGGKGIKYISSTSGSDGSSSISIAFQRGQNVDLAAVDIQARISAALDRMPEQVRASGVRVDKATGSISMIVALSSEKYSTEFLSNYASSYVNGALERVPGVAKIQMFGERKYAMRIWLDPHKLAAVELTPLDVLTAIQEQNFQAAGGQIGQAPAPAGQAYQMTVKTSGRLTNKSDFEEIILKAGTDGSFVKLKDVARLELGAEDYSSHVHYNSKDAVAIAIYNRSDANAIDVSNGINENLKRLSKGLPQGIEAAIAFDSSTAVRKSIEEVLQTLAQAILLVVLVIFIFLEDWRTTLIPTITIPVSLIGTFWFMNQFGFSINVLSLFGITLATGLVVDDAIVVVENVIRYASEKGISPKEAAAGAMAEVCRAIIGISLVLCAVFVPIGFFAGTTGELYKQFALTIAVSVAISTFNSLTLAPALSALWLKGKSERKSLIQKLFVPTNFLIELARKLYKSSLVIVLKLWPIALCFFVVCLGATYWLLQNVPSGYIPDEDQGYFVIMIQAPQGVTLNYTTGVLTKVEKILATSPEIVSNFGVSGAGFTGVSTNSGMVFVLLKPWSQRVGQEHSLNAVIDRLRLPLSQISEAAVVPFNPPSVPGLGTFGGFTFEVQDMSYGNMSRLADAVKQLVAQANQTPGLAGVFSTFEDNSPQLSVLVDREKAKSMGVNISSIYEIMQILLGSQYVNDFALANRSCRVFIEADQQYRCDPQQITEYYVRSNSGKLIQLKNMIKISRTSGASTISHYNLFRSAEINGSAGPGVSSGKAIQLMQDLANKILPQGMTYSWSGLSLEEIEAGSQTIIIFSLGILAVFMVLAAQYENLFDPLVVLIPLPLAVMGALSAQFWRGLENDIFCRIGLVMLVGLTSKNAVLIVEFANRLRSQGEPLLSAIIDASVIRWRPIVMTSVAFIMGILPLTVTQGAGAEARHSLGTAVCGGMIVSTLLSLYIVPVIYLAIHGAVDFLSRLAHRRTVTVADNLNNQKNEE
ncbi:MAG: efflux RND transporter permease subunit [Candidatus Obscuribacterales bacterium]|nr:efflux RND transporter permease subunit [Candidatus Obscuribacterales bacterium]